MSERPIPFRGDMIRAIMAGQKTQTRRIIKRFHDGERWASAVHKTDDGQVWTAWWPGNVSAEFSAKVRGVPCPYGIAGDHLWAREAHALGPEEPRGVLYRATMKPVMAQGYRWRPGIFMPRWASRLTLQVEDVRVQRLGDMTEEEAIVEGTEPIREEWGGETPHLSAFILGWQSMHGPESWPLPGEKGPWVWVIEFRRI